MANSVCANPDIPKPVSQSRIDNAQSWNGRSSDWFGWQNNRWGKEWRASQDPAAVKALSKMTSGFTSGPINAALRSGVGLEDAQFARVSLIDTVMETSALDRDVMGYRVVASDFGASLEAGTLFVDEGYAATTVVKKAMREIEDIYPGKDDPYKLSIFMPKGTNGASTFGLPGNQYGYQAEFLIDRQTMFRVRSIDHETREALLEVVLR